ncbi:ubiquitin-like-conjugating enzyme ATG10 isoform X1 [Heptranchias perlo]|uniref:ubiquitin-like-conjugating enzyme ATG10 isoform X1 n=1 Tax=Heptranchias perlo TaxID=212740 RepID=UPI00355A8E61
MKKQYGLVLNFGHVNIRIFPDWEAIHSVCLQMSNNFNQNENICLGKQQFQQFCKLFIRHSDEIHNGWEWRQKELNEGYMVKVHLRSKNSKNNSVVGDHCLQSLQCLEAESLSEEEVNLENVSNDTEEAQVTTSELIRYEYHVVYSSSYQAPVLYFRACYSDGRPLALKEIWENVHDCYKERLFQGPWDTITQQEHHLLGQPFFVLHPCRTPELMTPIMDGATQEKRNVNYITSWLSMMGPVVGLDLPLSYATAVSQGIFGPD